MVDYGDYSGQAVITVVMVGCDDDDDDDGQVVIVVMMVGCGDGGQVVIGPKEKYVCFLFHPVKSLGRVGRLFFFFNFFYNLILTTNIQHIKVAHNLEHRSGISRHV